MQELVPLKFFVCSWENAQAIVAKQRPCDGWIDDWPDADFYWLFGNYYGWLQKDYSPLARGYYDRLTGEINDAINQALNTCENQRYVSQPVPESGVRLIVSSRLNKNGLTRNDSQNSSIVARLSLPFSSSTTSPQSCPPIPRELFSKPVSFDYTLHGAVGSNFRWELRDAQTITPDPYFDLYGRTLKFIGNNAAQWLGNLHLVIDRLLELQVRFETRPIPAAVASRVDQNQPLRYQVSSGSGYFSIAAAIEVQHLESGQIYSASIHGGSHSPTYLPPLGEWPDDWKAMSMDAEGFIRHNNGDFPYSISTLNPASLPATGTYRLRYILLGWGYRTENRYVSSTILQGGDNRLSWKPISLSHTPTLITYTQGMSDGLMPAFETIYTRSPVLANGIEFDAVFDLKNLTTFRFVVKVTNHHDFALGVIVQAAGWQTWITLPAGESKHLAGSVSVSGMANWHAYPLHPQSPFYGWNSDWSNGDISMVNGQLSIPFRLFLTTPTQPETIPANLPAKKATQPWLWDVASWDPQFAPKWAAIKRYAFDAQYDYNAPNATLKTIHRATTQPAYQEQLNPSAYFVTGYNTSTDDGSTWHKRPWPSAASVPIMCSGEQKLLNVWTPKNEISLMLTRSMLQEVAATLGVTEYVLIDGDDLRWCQPSPTGAWHNVLWIDRFYTRGGAVIDAAAMRTAFQNVIANNAAHWPNYRNLTVHAAVRFGRFLDDGGFEVGDYLLGQNGDMIEVSSLADLASISTRFLYRINPANQ